MKLFYKKKGSNEQREVIEGCFYRLRDLENATLELETILLKMANSPEGKAFNENNQFDGTTPYEVLFDLKNSLIDMNSILKDNHNFQ